MVYHVVDFHFIWRNSYTDQTGFSTPQGLVSHEVLMALIQGGEPAQKSYLASHTDFDVCEISNVTMYYNLSKRYTQDGRSLDGGPDWQGARKRNETSTRGNGSFTDTIMRTVVRSRLDDIAEELWGVSLRGFGQSKK